MLKVRGYNPKSLDSSGKPVPVPDEADVFKFTFSKDGKDFDNVWVTLEGPRNIVLYYDDDVMDSGSENTSKTGNNDTWLAFVKNLKNWAMRRQLGFELKNGDHLAYDMAQREDMKKKENISEGYYPMGKSASYNDNVPTVKIILQHTRQIQEGEQRYRNVARIFLENTQGERILAPTNKPGIAQVYARHLAEGGVPNDERWNHLKSLCEEYSSMAGFVRAVRGNQFNESAQRLVEEGLNHYQSLRESLGKMRGSRGYNAYFESWTPTLMENEGEETNLNELFVQETLDPRIESVMPILSRLRKNIGEMKEVSALAEWADSIIEDESLTSNNPVGIPEGFDPEQKQRLDDLISKYRDATDPSGYDDALDPDDIIDQIRQEFGDKIADTLEQGHNSHFPRDNHIYGYDPLRHDSSPRVTKSGMANRQDVSTLKSRLQQRAGRHAEPTLPEGKGDFSQAIEQLSGWDEVEPDEPGTRQYDFDDDEGGYYAQGTVVQDLKTGQIKIEFKDDGEYGGHEINDTFNSIGDAMNALRNITTRRSKSGKAQNFDTLGARELTGPDDVYKTDKIGKKGTLKKIRTDIMKASSPYRMRGGPKGVLPEEVDLGQYDAVKPISNSGTTPEQEKEFRKKVQAYGKELDQRQKEKEKGVTEGSHEEQVAKLAAYNEKMAGENPPIELGLREVGNWAKVGHYGDPIKTAWFNIAKYGIRNNKFNDSVDQAMSAIGDFPDKYDLSIPEIDTLYSAYETVYDQWEQSKSQQGVAEDLDANQKRVGQLGPTEKVKNNNIGKLVGANENFINQADQAVVSEEDEMAEGVLDAIKKGVAGAKQFGKDAKAAGKEAWDEVGPMLKQDWKHPIQAAMAKEGEMDEGAHTQHYDDANKFTGDIDHGDRPPTDWSVDPIEAGTDRIHQKISSMLKKLSKPKDTKELDEAAAPWEDEDEAEKREKEGKEPKDSKGKDGAEHGGHSRAKHLAKNAIPKEKEEVKEGQDDLDTIIRLVRK